MPYLTKADLTSHIYPEILTEIVRDYKTHFANLSAFPAVGVTGRYYIANNTALFYKWIDGAYVATPYIDLIELAIRQGIAEAKIYLNRFDKIKMLSDDNSLRIYQDDYLNSLIKDLVCWHLLKLSNPNINLELFRTAYVDAVKAFKDAMNGATEPGWPLYDDADTAVDESGHTSATSNIKRQNHY